MEIIAIEPALIFHFQFNKPAVNGTTASSSTDPAPQPGPSGDDPSTSADPAQPEVPSDIFDFYDKLDNDDEDGEDLKTVSFEVNQDCIEDIQKR